MSRTKRIRVLDKEADNLDNKQDTSMNGIDIAEAAETLGISVEAVRKRIQRGSLEGYKVGGRWYIVLDKQDSMSWTRPDVVKGELDSTSRTKSNDVQDNVHTYKEMVESLQDEISFLRQELSARTEENRRKDHIIAGLAQRIPELPSGVQDEIQESFKRELINKVQVEISATVQRLEQQELDREKRLEERDRKLMETLRAIQESRENESLEGQKRKWWLWGR